MASSNTKAGITTEKTHEGAPARRINPEQELRRSIMACMLWEDSFYESGVEIAERIKELVSHCRPYAVADMAVEAREDMKLRHAPLYLVRELARPQYKAHTLVSETLERIIQRPDELTEFLAIYWKNGKEKLSAQVKKGLAKAFTKFNEYSLAKYNRLDKAVKLRDVLFLCHAKPKDKEQEALWKRLIDNTMAVPDTWEVALSAGKDKKASWERLLSEKKLGALALLRNLRNMEEVNVDKRMIREALADMKTERVLPFRFIAAAKYAPTLEPEIEIAMMKCLGAFEKLPGKTALVIDNSGSMHGPTISARSEIDRAEAACALAILLREICQEVLVIAFSDEPTIIPPRRGFALRDAIRQTPSGGTYTDNALALAERHGYDRIIVVTDEQSHQQVRGPRGKGYFVNVATYKNGIGYGAWTHIDGWSEAIINYIAEYENEQKD